MSGGDLKGTQENPYTLRDVRGSSFHERRYKFCECSRCGKVERCTPEHDFYLDKAETRLYCESCEVQGRPVIVVHELESN